MKQFFTIYVEGVADQKFISDYFFHLYEIRLPKGNVGGIIDCGGKDKLDLMEESLKKTIDRGGVNLIIFDADNSDSNGGFEKRKGELENVISGMETKAGHSLNCRLFLFPNDKHDGTLEHLLECIINPKNAQIFDCWSNYESCLSGLSNPFSGGNPYIIPAKKSKIYSYLEVQIGNSKKDQKLIKDPGRDYLNPNHWDLNSEYLLPLKRFLTDSLL